MNRLSPAKPARLEIFLDRTAGCIRTEVVPAQPAGPVPFRPLLARLAKPDEAVAGLLASPKLDGVRCLVINGVPMARSLKPLPNRRLAALLSWAQLEGLDGELILGPPTAPDAYHRTTAAVMSDDADVQDLRFYVFDCCAEPTLAYAQRYELAAAKVSQWGGSAAALLQQRPVASWADVRAMESEAVAQGYEGLMLRSASAAYKYGRTAASGSELIKIKRFDDAEGVIVAVHPLRHNGNAVRINALGRTQRSSAKAGRTAAELLGALKLRDVQTGVEFDVGTGFTAAQRAQLWQQRAQLVGQLAKYRFQRAGAKTAPRFPVFLGLRSGLDMGGAA